MVANDSMTIRDLVFLGASAKVVLAVLGRPWPAWLSVAQRPGSQWPNGPMAQWPNGCGPREACKITTHLMLVDVKAAWCKHWFR